MMEISGKIRLAGKDVDLGEINTKVLFKLLLIILEFVFLI